MPFGLTNAPATCQALLNNVIRKHLDITAIVYLDDILIYSESVHQHAHHVKEILECLSKANLRLNPKKCFFHVRQVEFLGYLISTDGITMDPEKIRSVKEWPTPTTLKQVQEFLGFCNFNRRFIEHYSMKSLPLVKLTKKNQPFQWKKEQEDAFQSLKNACISAPTLINFRPNLPLRMETDASDLALRACISQNQNGNWHPIAYFSRKFSPAEQKYDVHNKELLAIISALQHWRVYMHSCSELEILTDHKNLQHFNTSKALNGRQIRWSQLIQEYDFKITYNPGRDNGRADALSRRVDIAGEKAKIERPIFRTNEDGSLSPYRHLNTILTIQATNSTPLPDDEFGKSPPKDISGHRIYNGRTYVPASHRQRVIRQHHDDPEFGHPGVTKTMELLQRSYDFPNVRASVRDYIRRCDTCCKTKHPRHATYGQLQTQEPPESPWQDITMDFITKLPTSTDMVTKEKYDLILVIVDKLTKYTEMIPFKETYTATELGHILLDKLIRHHGIPASITSDRDKLFTSAYWTTLITAMGTKRKLSTAFHPQTDGQTERMNQTLEQYLRGYVNRRQNNWTTLLPLAQLAFNNHVSDTTKQTPFFANHGRHPNLFCEPRKGPRAEHALRAAQDMKDLHDDLRTAIQKRNETMQTQVNQHRKEAPDFQIGDKVYLSTRNLRIKKGLTKKLDQTRIGPFQIKDSKGRNAFELELPADARIHPVFNVQLLEPANPDTPVQTTMQHESYEETEFEVERIVNHRKILGNTELLIKWKGYPESENTWEPEAHLDNCQRMLHDYKTKYGLR